MHSIFSLTCLVFGFLTVASFVDCYAKGNPPHIIYILADDMGWNDVSFHGSPQIPTPNIDALASAGIVLNNYYAAPQCTPSRAALMTGKYTINTALQHYVLTAAQPSGLPLNFTILPQHLKRLGYSTSLVGKWHLGYFKKEYTPNYRGFDKFFGYLNGRLNYFDYTHYDKLDGNEYWGVDLRENEKLIMDFRGQYATDLFTDRIVEVIREHNVSKPLFLMFASIATHNGNPFEMIQALPQDVAKFKYIKDIKRRTYAGVVARLDACVGRIFQALGEKNMLSNSIIVFTSDNGGPRDSYSSNWPLKGQKFQLFEGGVRVPGLIWSPLLRLKEPRTSYQLMHTSDWLPTLYHAAGGDENDLGDIDGLNMWPQFVKNTPSPRFELVLNIDPIYDMAAIRIGDYKFVTGEFPRKFEGLYGPSGEEDVELNTSLDEWVWKDGSIVKDILEKSGWWLAKTPDSWRVNLTLNCWEHQDIKNISCDPVQEPCLYNIVRDPCEYENIAASHPIIVQFMKQRIQAYEENSLLPFSPPNDRRADPVCHGFAFVPWLDDEYRSDCPYF